MGKCREIEDVIKKHCAIMDEYDPKKHVALMLDEWGTWWDEEPGTIPGHLYQQNTLRDAFVASLSFDIFHKYTDRLKMANIAQIVNVLQSMILTKGKRHGADSHLLCIQDVQCTPGCHLPPTRSELRGHGCTR